VSRGLLHRVNHLWRHQRPTEVSHDTDSIDDGANAEARVDRGIGWRRSGRSCGEPTCRRGSGGRGSQEFSAAGICRHSFVPCLRVTLRDPVGQPLPSSRPPPRSTASRSSPRRQRPAIAYIRFGSRISDYRRRSRGRRLFYGHSTKHIGRDSTNHCEGPLKTDLSSLSQRLHRDVHVHYYCPFGASFASSAALRSHLAASRRDLN
jgi:hypothetical protein